MNRLNLDAFKAKMSTEETQKTENLIGGILGDCHCVTVTTIFKCPGGTVSTTTTTCT